VTASEQSNRPLELGLMFTHRCPIACRHCGILSGPDNHNSMDPALALRCIDEAAALDPRPTTIVFTGGEPMMFPDTLETLLARCSRHELTTRVITNGFWGRNLATGRRLLCRLALAGLDSLNFSADKFHLEFLDAATFRNAIAIAEDVGFEIVVNTVINAPGDPLEGFCRLYGIARHRVRLLEEDGLSGQAGMAADAAGMINISLGRLIGLGRAADHPEEHFLSPLSSFPRTGCGEVVNRPVIYPDGSFQACCCAGGKIAEFTVGNVNEQPLAVLFASMRERSHYRFINRFGPRSISEAMHGDGGQEALHASICDVCVSATHGLSPAEVDRRLHRWSIGQFLMTIASNEKENA
jgi:Radical SAM superfamily/4Fe-4S single cluster domain